MFDLTRQDVAGLSVVELPSAFAELSSAMAEHPEALDVTTAQFAELLHYSGELVVAKGWLGLLDIFSLLGEKFDTFTAHPGTLGPEGLSAIADWAELLQDYLFEPQNPNTSSALIEYVCRPCWGLGIEQSHAADLQQMLGFIPVNEESLSPRAPNLHCSTDSMLADPDLEQALAELSNCRMLMLMLMVMLRALMMGSTF